MQRETIPRLLEKVKLVYRHPLHPGSFLSQTDRLHLLGLGVESRPPFVLRLGLPAVVQVLRSLQLGWQLVDPGSLLPV